MKKLSILALVAAVLICFSTPSFAVMRKDMGVVKGKIVSIKPESNEITVIDSSDGQEKSFTVKRGVASLESGNEVSVIYKLGTNYATNVTVKKPRY